MPKLCQLGYDYERTAAALEGAEERLAEASERIGREVEAAKREHWKAQDLLWQALVDNPGKTLLAGKYAYHLERDQIIRTDPWYGHEEWVEGSTQRAKLESITLAVAPDLVTALIASWGTIEPRVGEAGMEPDCDDVDTEDYDLNGTEPDPRSLSTWGKPKD